MRLDPPEVLGVRVGVPRSIRTTEAASRSSVKSYQTFFEDSDEDPLGAGVGSSDPRVGRVVSITGVLASRPSAR